MRVLLALCLAACGTDGPDRVDAFPDYAAPSGDRSIPLHVTPPSRIDLGAPSLANLDAIGDTFALDVEEVPNPNGVRRRLKVLRARLPFNVPGGRFAPRTLRVEIDGTPVAFERGKAAMATRSTWRVNGRHLVLSHPEIPAPGSVVVHWPGLRDKLIRRDPSRSGLDPEAFVRYDLTLNGVTRHGLMLPAPSHAEWDLDLPAGTTSFEAWTAIERAPLPEPVPDPAEVVLSVGPPGGPLEEVARRTLRRDDEAFSRWTVDLSRWAGQRVTLRLAAEPVGNPWFDWAFLGAPTVRAAPEGDVRHVVVLAMDTTRPDHFGFHGYERPTTPHLDAIGAQSVAFERAWSVAPRTRPSFRSAFTGRLPLDAVGQPNAAEVFQREGFATAGIVANVHLQPRFDFDHGFDWWHYDNNADADAQVDLALDWLRDHRDRDTFLFLHFMDPHMPYRAPGTWRDRFVTDPDPTLPAKYSRFEVNRWSRAGRISDQRKAHIQALHDGELAFMDHEIGRFFDGLDALGGRVLTVLHTDHGEEFWDHGAFEHNHSLYDETTRVLLWFRPNAGLARGRRVTEPVTLMDIAPTLYDLFGFEDTPPADGRSLAPYLRGEEPAADPRPLPVGYLQYERERWGVVWQDHKYILHTASGAEELYDLRADPAEQHNLAPTTDLQPWRDALSRAHGVPVHPGLRIFVDLDPGSAPVRVDLPGPVLGAGVLDPETDLVYRANREWGEPPRRVPEDVGEVALDPDSAGFVFTPGAEGNGILWVQADAPLDPGRVRVVRDGAPLPLQPSPDGPRWATATESIRVAPGAVLVPPPGEAARMGIATGGPGAVSDDERRKLCALGYLAHGCDSP